MMMVLLVQWYSRIEIPGIQSRIRIEYFSFEQQTMNNEKQTNQMKTKVEQKMNGKVVQRTKKTNNNNKYYTIKWYISTMHNINKSRASLLK
jgi:hypothetical protein